MTSALSLSFSTSAPNAPVAIAARANAAGATATPMRDALPITSFPFGTAAGGPYPPPGFFSRSFSGFAEPSPVRGAFH